MFYGCSDGRMIPPFLVNPESKLDGHSALTGGTRKGAGNEETVSIEEFLVFS